MSVAVNVLSTAPIRTCLSSEIRKISSRYFCFALALLARHLFMIFFAHSAKREAAQNLISVTMLRQLLLPQLLLVLKIDQSLLVC